VKTSANSLTASGFGVYYLDDVYEAISNVSK